MPIIERVTIQCDNCPNTYQADATVTYRISSLFAVAELQAQEAGWTIKRDDTFALVSVSCPDCKPEVPEDGQI